MIVMREQLNVTERAGNEKDEGGSRGGAARLAGGSGAGGDGDPDAGCRKRDEAGELDRRGAAGGGGAEEGTGGGGDGVAGRRSYLPRGVREARQQERCSDDAGLDFPHRFDDQGGDGGGGAATHGERAGEAGQAR